MWGPASFFFPNPPTWPERTIHHTRTHWYPAAVLSMLGQSGRDSLAVEIDQIRESLVSSANTTYLGRPVFGGQG